MNQSLEQYFMERVPLPEQDQGAFTEAERDFLTRYLGPDFQASLASQGLARPAVVESVTGPLGAEAEAGPVAKAMAEAAAEAPVREAVASDAALEAALRQAREIKFVGFTVAGQELALPIAQVQEVLRAMPVTRLPAAPPHIRGILNLRGRVVPMVDVTAVMDFAGAGGEPRFIVVCRCRGMLVGLMVEGLTTMHQADGQDIEWGVEARIGVASGLVSGLLKADGRLVAIVSVDSLFQKVLKS